MPTPTAGPARTRSRTAETPRTHAGLRLAALGALVALVACRDHDPLRPGSSPSGVPPHGSAGWATPTRWVPMAPAASSDWEIRATADMNGDGKADVVWQNRATRQTGAWIMDGTTVQGWVAMQSAATGDWEIGGAADMSGDGKPDIVWQNRATRQTGVWIMDGTTVRSWVAMQAAATSDWEIGGVADMSRDGQPDIVWQNRATRQTGVWIMDGTTVRSWVAMQAAATGDWEIAGVADLSRDGSADVVWQNRATLETGVWEMDTTAVKGWVAMPAAPSSAWQIGGVGDLSGDGRRDVVWQNRSTRETAIWEMDVAPPPPPPPPADARHKVSYTSFWSPPYGMRAAAPWLAAVHTGEAGVASWVEIAHIQLWAEIDGVPRLIEENTYTDRVFGGELRDRVPWFEGTWEAMPATPPTSGVLVIRPGDRPTKVWHPYLEPCEAWEGWPCNRQDISRANRVWFEAVVRLHGPVAVQAGIDYYQLLSTSFDGNRLLEGAITDWEQTQDQWVTLRTERSTEVAGPIELSPASTNNRYSVGSPITATFVLRNADDDPIRLASVGIETLRLESESDYCDANQRPHASTGFGWKHDVDLAPGQSVQHTADWIPQAAGIYCIHVVEQRLGVRHNDGSPLYQLPYAGYPAQKIHVF